MNCKQGDLAIIVKSWAGNQGKFVTCVRLDAYRSGRECIDQYGVVSPPEPVWETDRNLPAWDGSLDNYIADSQLRPIRPQSDDATDEMVLIAGKPQEVTA